MLFRSRLDADAEVRLERSFDGHLVGQSWDTPFVPVPDGTIDGDGVAAMIAAFHDTYEERSRNRFDMVPVEGVTFRVRAVIDTPKVSYPEVPSRVPDDGSLAPARTATLRFLADDETTAPVYRRADLRADDEFDGPAIVDEGLSTTHVGAGQHLSVGRYGELVIRRAS